MRGRSSVTLFLCVCVGCAPIPEPRADTPIELEARPAQESPGPPTTLRLVLEVRAGGVRLISSDPRRGSLAEPEESEIRQDAIEGRIRVIRYVARDTAGNVLATGRFSAPAVAVAEFQDPDARTRIRRSEEPLETPIIRVAIPFHRAASTVAFEQLEPNPDAPIDKWSRTPIGEVSIPPSSEQRPPPAPRSPR